MLNRSIKIDRQEHIHDSRYECYRFVEIFFSNRARLSNLKGRAH